MAKPTDTITASIETITPDQASDLIQHMNGNRRWSKRLSERMAEDITSGKWSLNGESIVITEKGDLLDGQHRLQAIILAQKPIQSVVVRGVPNRLMTTLDQGRIRSNTDAFLMSDVPNYAVAAPVARNLLQHQQLGLVSSSFNASRSAVLKTYQENKEAIDAACTLSSAVWGKTRLSRGVCATAHVLIASASTRTRADQFFMLFCDAPESVSAIKALDRYMRARNRKRARTPELVAVIIKAWNAWRANEQIENLYFRANESFPDISK